ncbi:MAG: GNAT family N-acetyltransferase [Clostridiales bacterium]|nr:GNAT family N-acetyltransferase [Clostridiales bacterium]
MYKGPVPAEEYSQLIAELDDIFFADDEEPRRDFMTLLPKLYKKKYDPCGHNYALIDEGRIRASVGLFPVKFSVCGEELLCGGIGNVGVSRDSRSKGYMKEAMAVALDAMKAMGADFGMLGGQRQRYQYFSFDNGGVAYKYTVNRRNLEHCYGKDAKSRFICKLIDESTPELAVEADKLFRRLPACPVRDGGPEYLIDLFRSWDCTPYAVIDGDEVKGFFNLDRDRQNVSTFMIKGETDIKDVLLALFETLDPERPRTGISVPEYDLVLRRALENVCEDMELGHTEHFTVLNYEKTIRAFLKLKAGYHKLVDGEIRYLIHGENGDEIILVRVAGGKVTVEKTGDKADVELEHLEAVRYFFSFNSPRRGGEGGAPDAWFPLPVFVYGCDGV